MHYILESILVGLYCSGLYNILSRVISSSYLLLFLIGFIKHYIAYYLCIHSIYCKYDEVCKGYHKPVTYLPIVLIDSLLEGAVFVLVGGLFMRIVPFLQPLYLFFTLGAMIHIISEHVGIHTYYCDTRYAPN
jgi:hypothetical protein